MGLFRRVFERVIEACIAAGLVGGQGFAVDASLIVADANKQRSIPGSEWTQRRAAASASRAMREYLASLDDGAFGAASEVTPKFVSLFGDWKKSKAWMRTSPQFRADPIGKFVDPAAMFAARSGGVKNEGIATSRLCRRIPAGCSV
jgi:hypothetical protein